MVYRYDYRLAAPVKIKEKPIQVVSQHISFRMVLLIMYLCAAIITMGYISLH